MKVCLFFLVVLAALCAADVPKLYQIQEYSFEHPYSCGGNYSTSALFVTVENEKRNSPDLLWNSGGGTPGNCPQGGYFESATAGDDMAFFVDLGSVLLEDVSAQDVINVEAGWTYNQAKGAVGTTYALIEAKESVISIITFNITSITPGSGASSIMYSVLLFDYERATLSSRGLNYSQHSALKTTLNPCPLPELVPELYAVKYFTFTNSYSHCPISGSYRASAFFMTENARNDPDLLYYTSTDFDSATAGQDMAFFLELGNRTLESLTFQEIMSTKSGWTSDFAAVKVGSTYAVVESKSGLRRNLWAFNVSSNADPTNGCGPLSIFYTPLMYTTLERGESSPGFKWTSTPV